MPQSQQQLQAASAEQQLQSLGAILDPDSIMSESAITVCRNAAGAKILLGTGFFGKVRPLHACQHALTLGWQHAAVSACTAAKGLPWTTSHLMENQDSSDSGVHQ